MVATTTREGTADVPGASLRYRLAGKAGSQPLVVLENGWSGSYDYFALLQEELAPHMQVLLYNRAGIGGSTSHEPQSVEGISRNLSALLDALGFRDPFVIAGQTYGGLICGVHAALMPQRLRAVVQIDPTVERADPTIDSTIGGFRVMTRLLIMLAKLGVSLPSIVGPMHDLPKEDAEKLHRFAVQDPKSLQAAMVEMDLLPAIRAVCARPSPTPRLVISAERTEVIGGFLKLFISVDRSRALLAAAQNQHKITVDRGGAGSRWIKSPHTHAGLVMTRSGAAATATNLIDYVRALQPA